MSIQDEVDRLIDERPGRELLNPDYDESAVALNDFIYRSAGTSASYMTNPLERKLRDAHGARYHPLQEKRQHQFTGRLALGMDPVGQDTAPSLKAAAA